MECFVAASRTIQARLGLQDSNGPLFDLASLRPGGATWMLESTENAELVRRRGRWLSARVMEIYLQEVTAATFVPRLPAMCARRLSNLLRLSPPSCRRPSSKSYIPRKAWYFTICFLAGRPLERGIEWCFCLFL